jgi:hypothetical protein
MKSVTSVKKTVVGKPPPKKGRKGKKPDISKKKQQQAKTIKQEDSWSLVKVKTPINGVSNLQGWVKRNQIANDATTDTIEIYKNVGVPPEIEPPLHPAGSLPQGTKVRILTTSGNWAMVGIMNSIPRYRYLQGWIYMDELEKDQA